MENQEFFDTIAECIALKDGPDKSYFQHLAGKCNYSETCIDTYDETCDYRRIFLSYYYDRALYAYEEDFDGKPLATIAGRNATEQITAIMQKRETVKPYRVWDISFAEYGKYREKYDLV